MKSNSQFDTGRWSEITRLPHEADMTNYIEHLTSGAPTQRFSRTFFEEAIAKEFEITIEVQTAPGPESNTPQYRTSLSHVISNSIIGERNSDGNPFLKRVSFAEYQHASGPDITFKSNRQLENIVRKEEDHSRSVMAEAVAFMQHSKKMEFSLIEAKDMWKDRFPADVLNQAAVQVFH